MSTPDRPNPIRPRRRNPARPAARPGGRDAVNRAFSASSQDDAALARIAAARYPDGAGLTELLRALIHEEAARLDAAGETS